MAYEVLSNPEKRKLYDQAGEQGIKEGGSGGGGGMNPMDIFDMFFGGGGGDPFGRGSFGRQRGPRRTKNLVHQLSVSLEDMYNGTVRKLALQKNVICDGCEGIGGKPGAVQKCPNCRGTGMQVRIQQLGPGMMQQIQSMCGECHGEGERVDPKLRCKKCNGRKVNRERKKALADNFASWETFETEKVENHKQLDLADAEFDNIKKIFDLKAGPADYDMRMKTAANFRKGIEGIYETVSGANDCLQQMLPEDRKQGMKQEVEEIKTRMAILSKSDE